MNNLQTDIEELVQEATEKTPDEEGLKYNKLVKNDNDEFIHLSPNHQILLTDRPGNNLETEEDWTINPDTTTLIFEDLSYSVLVKNRDPSGPKYIHRPILRNISGICKPGELTALMGASGAGKTSLLNILSCRVSSNGKKIKITGDYLVNGNEYNGDKFSKFAGYVMQNDILMETLTPREIFMFTAELRIKASPSDKIIKVNQLLSELKLDNCADTFVGGQLMKGISGGERKRVSIGVELITDPKLLFLDEPTSGLDSFTAFLLLSLLKSLAEEGRAIIFTIHQPSSDIFFLFDRLMILAKGKFIYQGPATMAVSYFAEIGYKCPEYSNPADYFIEIAHAGEKEDDSKFEKMFNHYDQTQANSVRNEIKKVTKKSIKFLENQNNFWSSTKIVAHRARINFFRSPVYLRARIGQTLFFSFMACSLFFQLSDNPSNPINQFNINGALFFNLVLQFLTAAMTIVLTFPSERAVFLKEYSSNMYSATSYFVGRQLIELPMVILFPVIMSSIMYYIIGFNDAYVGKFFIYAIIIDCQALAGNAMGLLAGCAFSDVKVATGVVPLTMIPMMVFGGFYVNSNNMPKWIGWFQYCSPFRYAMEALMWNEYEDSPFGTQIMDQYGFKIGLWGCFFAVFAAGCVLRILALFALKKFAKKLQ